MQSYYKFIELLKEHYVRFKPKENTLEYSPNGFDNYLSIKNRHFRVIESFLKTQKVSNDIANKLYDFFSSYLNASGTPFFIKTPLHKNIYAPVYNNSDDVSLFYKTKNLYYVKTDTIYKDVFLEFKDHNINISAKNLEQKKDNNKSNKEISLELVSIDEKNINFNAYFKTDSEKNFKDIKKSIENTLEISFTENDYKDIKQEFKKQNTIDFFIHKNAEKFLKEQFDLFIYHYFYKDLTLDTQWSDERLEELKNLKLIAYKIIELIAKLENEVLRIWLKPKFAKNLNYVFSLDLLKELEKEIISDEGFKAQCEEWAELGMKYESFDSTLPLDTKYFSPKIREKILSHFDNLNDILNGELIKSDNFNALNTLKNKYRGKIDLIYIDPPFNTGTDFEYIDRFQTSTWISLIKDRLEISRELLSEKGSFYLHLDENADYLGRLLLGELFSQFECKKITFDTNATKDEEADLFGYKSFGNNFALKSSTIFFLKQKNSIFNKLWKPNRNTSNLKLGQLDLIAKSNVGNPKKIEDFNYFIEKWSNNNLELQQISLLNEKIYPISDIWNDIYSFTQSEMRVSENISFASSQKPENLLRRIIQASSNQNSIVLDFFAGSGTTLAVAHKLNRKYVGVEMGDYFYETYETYDKQEKKIVKRLGLLGRMKQVINGDENFIAIDKKRRSHLSKALDFKGGGAFVYYELESYEEALRECEYISDDLGLIDYKKSRKLIKSLDKKEKLYIDLKHEYFKDLDIFVSFANIYGLSIISYEIKNDELYINTSDGKSYCMKDLDLGTYVKLRDYLWWKSNE